MFSEPSHAVRIGLKYVQMNTTAAALREVWEVADQSGFDHLWAFDHLLPLTTSATGWYSAETGDPIFEGWTTLACMAALTCRVRIGVNVTGNLYRHPGLLAKMAATVDHFSDGRLEMGIGAAHAEREFVTLGMPFPPVAERLARLAEAIEVMKLLWTEEIADYPGAYYQLTGAVSAPKPVQKPHPPIWIGGRGERKTLRIVARHADVWNIPGGAPEEAERLSRVLDGHCEAIGRDPASVRRSVGIRFDRADPDAALRAGEAMLARGFTELIVTVAGPDAARQADGAAETLIPAFRGTGTAVA
jgi:F420-dependent oxidoreductase-like protein